MKKWFQHLGDKMRSFMYGRYGYDELSRAMSVTALICLLLAMFTGWQILSSVALVLWVWALIRGYSKNISKRQLERQSYLRFTGKIKGWFDTKKRAWSERKTHRYFKCPSCKKTLRVPKGKGKIKITCPECKTQITKKT